MCDHTAKLPPELRRMVCELIPRKSLEDVRLVSQSWGHVAAALLWHTFTSDLDTSSGRDFDALLTSQPGNFLDSVRILNIRHAGLWSSQTNTKLLQLLSLLPRGLLQVFTVDHAIDRRTLGVLVARQPCIRELSSPISQSDGVHGPPGERFVAGKLKCLENLNIFANTDQAGYDAWFPHTPLLNSLTVFGKLNGTRSSFKPWKSEPKLKKLRSLFLDNLNFSGSAGALDTWLDLSCLHNLTLHNCLTLQDFLETLAESYTSYESTALKSFVIFSDRDADWVDELEFLLDTVSSLDNLYISFPSQQKTDLHIIGHQMTSLRYLVVDHTHPSDLEEDGLHSVYDNTALQQLSDACPNIEELGVGCPQFTFSDWDYLEPFQWSSVDRQSSMEKALVKFLDSIASFPKLRVLRLTQAPIQVADDDQNNGPYLERQWRYQQFAEQLLQYLAKKNSPIELLAFSPTRMEPDSNLGHQDSSNHRWPHYYYLRGEATTMLPGRYTKKQTVAVPVSYSDIKKYIKEPQILVDPKRAQ